MITRAASVKQLRSSVAKSPPKRAPLKEINLQEERTPAGKVRGKKKEETTEVAVAAEIVQPGGPGARTSSSEFEGWTMEQYADLQKAYAMVRPGPNFWQEVARQVQISFSLHRSVWCVFCFLSVFVADEGTCLCTLCRSPARRPRNASTRYMQRIQRPLLHNREHDERASGTRLWSFLPCHRSLLLEQRRRRQGGRRRLEERGTSVYKHGEMFANFFGNSKPQIEATREILLRSSRIWTMAAATKVVWMARKKALLFFFIITTTVFGRLSLSRSLITTPCTKFRHLVVAAALLLHHLFPVRRYWRNWRINGSMTNTWTSFMCARSFARGRRKGSLLR